MATSATPSRVEASSRRVVRMRWSPMCWQPRGGGGAAAVVLIRGTRRRQRRASSGGLDVCRAPDPPSGEVAGLVPGLDDRVLAIPAEDRDGRGAEREQGARCGRQIEPASGQDPQEMAVREDEDIAVRG